MTWKVKLAQGPLQHFYDIQRCLGSYYELQKGWIQRIQSLLKTKSHYNLHLDVIKAIKGPKGRSLIAPFILLLVTKTQLTVTFLGELTEDESACLIGVWPNTFRNLIKSDKKALLNLLYIAVEKPKLVEQIDFYF
jgi:hypothetical protein